MKLIIFLSTDRYRIVNRGDWEIFSNPQEVDPYFNHAPKYKQAYVDAINNIKPDFVVHVCQGANEQDWINQNWPKGPKYITWSTDSYRHTPRITTSDLHLSSIPDTLQEGDEFLPLFNAPKIIKPYNERTIQMGKIWRPYPGLANNYRINEVGKIKQLCGDIFHSVNNVAQKDYYKTIKNFKYCLNLSVYPDSLPNYRSFEAGLCGVMPISPANNRKILEELFEDNIRIYDSIEEIPDILKEDYDAAKLQKYYVENHTLQQRLHQLFKKYYNLDFPLIEEDYKITQEI